MRKNKNIVESFQNAFKGLLHAFKNERNLPIHLAFIILIILMGIFLKISSLEWLVCLIFFVGVTATELINTAIENTVNICSPQESQLARLAKDVAAGAVLIWTLGSVIAGLIIFLPKLLALFNIVNIS